MPTNGSSTTCRPMLSTHASYNDITPETYQQPLLSGLTYSKPRTSTISAAPFCRCTPRRLQHTQLNNRPKAMATKRPKVPADAYGYRAPGSTNQIKNMPEAHCSDWRKFHVYMVDDVERGPDVQGGAGSPGAVQHERVCNDFYDVFSNVFTDCTVHSLRMQPGEREADFTQRIDTILEQYTSQDLVVFYYHGKAGGTGDDYTW